MASFTAPTTNAIKSGVITNLDASPILRPSVGNVGGVLQRYVATATPAASQATTDLIRMVRIPSNAIVQNVALLFDTAAGSSGAILDIGVWYSDAGSASGSTPDGTSMQGNAGNLTAISSAFFADKFNCQNFYPSVTSGVFTKPSDGTTIASSIGPVSLTYANANNADSVTDGVYLPSQSYLPIWQAMANSIALQTTPTGAFTKTTQQAHFNTASAGASVYVRSDDPGGFFDICIQYTTTGVTTNQLLTLFVDIIAPGA